MTISANVSGKVTYSCNGVTTSFPTTFKFLDADHLTVTRITIADGTRVVMPQDTDTLGDLTPWTATGAGNDAGGTVTFGTATLLGSEYQLEIRRSTPILQEVDLVHNDGADAESHEDALDRLTMICQDLERQVGEVVADGASAITVDNTSPVGGAVEVPIYSKQEGSRFLLRRLSLDSTFFGLALAQDVAEITLTGLIEYVGNSLAPDLTSGTGVLQLKQTLGYGYPSLVCWEDGAAANVGRWALHHTATGVLSIAAMTDDLQTASDFLQFTRSSATAVSTKLAVAMDANSKRIGNVGALDFEEQDKGNVTGNVTFDFSSYNTIKATFTGNVVATFTAPNGPTTTYLEVTQDGSGGHTITFPGAVKWTAATLAGDKLLSTGAGKRDLIALKWNGAGTAALTQIFKDW